MVKKIKIKFEYKNRNIKLPKHSKKNDSRKIKVIILRHTIIPLYNRVRIMIIMISFGRYTKQINR